MTAGSLEINLTEQVVVSGWLKGSELLELEVSGTTGENAIQQYGDGPVSIVSDVGSEIRSLKPGSQMVVTASAGIRAAGLISADGNRSSLRVASDTQFRLLQGGIVRTTGAESQLVIEGGQSVLTDPGSAVLAGVAFQQQNGTQVPISIGPGAQRR
ncbi:MAG UNVERIFIED_CONTAM: hypothetical protein LVR18_14455 [Planctomycetaceae bacterium]